MSRIGRHPVAVPAGVTVEIKENNHVIVKGAKGTRKEFCPLRWILNWKTDRLSLPVPMT